MAEETAEKKTGKVRIILASSSPRRSELMEEAGYEFDARAAKLEENIDPEADPTATARNLARRKANVVASTICTGLMHPGDATLIIGADTVVACDGEIFGKPKDEDDARRMLKALSGTTHEVVTGVCINKLTADDWPREDNFDEHTSITFRELTDEEIDEYLATGEWKDKAGGYGIQAEGGGFVEEIDGDFDNVVGLPVTALKEHLEPYFA